ncbi:MAG: hypothetical protein ACM3X6_13350 [Patescibacteria group bacterium]
MLLPEQSFLHQFVCPVCTEERLVLAADAEGEPFLGRCGVCGYTVLFSWCPECGAGGPAPLEPGREPGSAHCHVCRRSYRIPPAAYAHTRPAVPPAPPAGPGALARWFIKALAALAGILMVSYLLIKLH